MGDTGTGKSSLVLRFARWTFHPDLLPTLALDYQVLKAGAAVVFAEELGRGGGGFLTHFAF